MAVVASVWVIVEGEARGLVTRALGRLGHAVHGFGSTDALLRARAARDAQPDVVLFVGPRADAPELEGVRVVAISAREAFDPRRLAEVIGGGSEMELISEGQIQQALAIQKDRGGALGEILVSLGYVTEDEMLFALAAQAGMDVVDLDDHEIPRAAIAALDRATVDVYRIVPISLDDGVLTIAMADPLNVNILDDLRFMLPDYELVGAVSSPAQVEAAIARYYGTDPEGAS